MLPATDGHVLKAWLFLSARNNNRKVAITLLFSSHFQMAEITGLLRLQLLSLSCNMYSRSVPHQGHSPLTELGALEGSEASSGDLFLSSFFELGLLFFGENGKIIVSLTSHLIRVRESLTLGANWPCPLHDQYSANVGCLFSVLNTITVAHTEILQPLLIFQLFRSMVSRKHERKSTAEDTWSKKTVMEDHTLEFFVVCQWWRMQS